MHRALCLSLALLVTTSTAQAFRPADGVYLGVEPKLVHRTQLHEQLKLAETTAWRRFERDGGQGWAARFDQQTGQPLRAWGPGLDLGPVTDGRSVDAAVRALIARHEDLFGANTRSLRTRSVAYSERNQTWYLDLDRIVDSAPIYRAGVTARIERGRLVLFGAQTYPDAPLLNARALDAPQAQEIARSSGPAPRAVHTDEDASLVWLPTDTGHGVGLTLAWQTTSRTEQPVGAWVSFVDAETGELLSVYNEVRFFQAGTVLGEHHLRRPDGELVVSPMPWVTVTDGGASADADDVGNYWLDSDARATSALKGSWLTVSNREGANGSINLAPETLWTTANATQAEIDSYVFLHHIRDWTATWAPELSISRSRFVAHVNINDSCNAFYDGTVNFFRASRDCRNTGEIADVNYHEFGHGVHTDSIVSGFYDASLGEGAADVIAFFQTNDPIVAPGFMTNGDGIRRVDTGARWPDDFVNNDNYIHYNGLIFAGSVWDLWHQMRADLGDEEGTRVTTNLFLGSLVGGPDLETAYEETVLADDDDGDLGNGTPHQCSIIDAFGLHGLGPRGQGSGLAAHHNPSAVPLAGAHPVQADLVNLAPHCLTLAPAQASAHYRVDGGSWQVAQLAVSANDVRGAIPEQPLGSFVEYYLSVEDDAGGTLQSPEGGAINPFSYYVGDVVPVRCDDFEASDGGYTHALLSGDDRGSSDDWAWGQPGGLGGDPSNAASGVNAWGNDLGRSSDGEYQNAVSNVLRSPVMNTGHYTGVFLQYQRWLTVEDGVYDQASIAFNDSVIWVNHASDADNGLEHHLDQQWTPHAVDLHGLADGADVQLSWEIVSDRGATFGGWNIDDVCLYAPATPDNRLGIDDFTALPDAEAGLPRLSWTNPKHAPLAEVVVVRRRHGYPDSHSDGKVVYRDTNPSLGAAVSILDENASDNRAYYYAVYASDGEDWYSLTIPRHNTMIGGAVEGLAPKGCSSSDSRAAWLSLGLGLVLLRRRKRA